MRSFWMIFASAAVLSAGSALAQSPPADKAPAPPQTSPQTTPRDATACGPSGTHAAVGQGGKDVVVRKPKDDNLSSKLAQSDGVICPPTQVDPEIHAPAPQGGPMPVIPPPGSPGGDPKVQPK
jgi:hypothetical protein